MIRLTAYGGEARANARRAAWRAKPAWRMSATLAVLVNGRAGMTVRRHGI